VLNGGGLGAPSGNVGLPGAKRDRTDRVATCNAIQTWSDNILLIMYQLTFGHGGLSRAGGIRLCTSLGDGI
jgi:hypothetical protein